MINLEDALGYIWMRQGLKMIFRIILLYCCLLRILADPKRLQRMSHVDCRLTGYMTDVQSWVNEDGTLNSFYVNFAEAIETSYLLNPVPILQEKLSSMRNSPRQIKYLSMAKCGLTRVPLIFQLRGSRDQYLSDTIEYMTFYGNNFVTFEHVIKEYEVHFNATGAKTVPVINTRFPEEKPTIWSSSLQETNFPRLRELDLRACFIQILNPLLFKRMKNLEALYIGENEIFRIDAAAFSGLDNLRHLDFSRNYPMDEDGHPKDLAVGEFYTFQNLTNLVSLDLSHTKLTQNNRGMIISLGKSLKSLSLCDTGLRNVRNGILQRTSLEILDISHNSGLMSSRGCLLGLENSLAVLFAKDTALQTMDIFRNFRKLQVLQLSDNEIFNLTNTSVETLQSLKILDLDKNRLSSWFEPTFSLMPNLRLLSLRENNINIMSEEMIQDLEAIDYLALSANFVVCNCHVKDFYRMTASNDMKFKDSLIKSSKRMYHFGYDYYNRIILDRNPVPYDFQSDTYEEMENTGRFRLIDYGKGLYTCFQFPERKSVLFSSVTGCNVISRDQVDYDEELGAGWNKLLIMLVIPCVLLPMLFIFIFRRNLRYCFIIMRNSAMLSMINKNGIVEDSSIFNYDVFVSYCNEDRGWVLDHLLPHMESEYSVSACLHERDFQVGLSILENIVSCMDRSRSIMLIISQRFLLSQWCQFEMHLAQHRLLETRREDLILVLLEDIPRRLRPNTLHYLMLTKTYIVWPKVDVDIERAIFWRRLQKSLLSQKVKQTENVSIA